MNKPKIKHEFNQYGMENISYKNKFGVYKLSDSNSCYVKVYCDKEDLQEVESKILRHVDYVDHTSTIIDGVDQCYVVEGEEEAYHNSWTEALLASLDPEQNLESLHMSKVYDITLSSRANDSVKDSNTDRTGFKCATLGGIIKELAYKPYIHKLDDKLTAQEKSDLYKLSLLIQKKLGKEEETREVAL